MATVIGSTARASGALVERAAQYPRSVVETASTTVEGAVESLPGSGFVQTVVEIPTEVARGTTESIEAVLHRMTQTTTEQMDVERKLSQLAGHLKGVADNMAKIVTDKDAQLEKTDLSSMHTKLQGYHARRITLMTQLKEDRKLLSGFISKFPRETQAKVGELLSITRTAPKNLMQKASDIVSSVRKLVPQVLPSGVQRVGGQCMKDSGELCELADMEAQYQALTDHVERLIAMEYTIETHVESLILIDAMTPTQKNVKKMLDEVLAKRGVVQGIYRQASDQRWEQLEELFRKKQTCLTKQMDMLARSKETRTAAKELIRTCGDMQGLTMSQLKEIMERATAIKDTLETDLAGFSSRKRELSRLCAGRDMKKCSEASQLVLEEWDAIKRASASISVLLENPTLR